jgi:hypothetical protein
MSSAIQNFNINVLSKNITESVFQEVMATHKYLNRDMYRALLPSVKLYVVASYIDGLDLKTVTDLIEEYGIAKAVSVYKSAWSAEHVSKLFSLETVDTYRFLLKAVLRYIILIETTTYKNYCAWRELQ